MCASTFRGLPPTNAWSGGLAGDNKSTIVVSFKALPKNIISTKDDGVLEHFFTTAPRNVPVYYSYWHEPEDNIARGSFTLADYLKAWADVVGLAKKANNTELHSTLVLMGFDVLPHSGRNWKSYLPPGNIISTISWDAYPPNGQGTPAPASFLGADVTAAKDAGMPFGFSEFATTTVSGRPAWLTSVGAYIAGSGAIYGTLYDAGENGGLGGSGTFVINDAASEHAWKGAVGGTGGGDTQPPSVPAGVTGHAISGSEIDLSWSASTDNVSVTGYNIYRDGKLAGTSTTASYKDTGLRSATTHLYSVSAHDAAGNVSAQSSTVSVTTSSSSGPSVPAGLAGHAVSGSEIDLSWTASTDGAGVKGYRIYRNGNMAGTSTVVSYRDKGLTGATAYQYSVSAYDAAGNVSAHSSTVSVTTSSSSGPSVPTGLAGTAVNAYRVTLSWTASTDNVSVTGYNIYRDGKLAGTSTTASYKDTGLRSATTHLYSVSAHDAAGNVSAQSSTVSVTTSSSSGPSVPAGLAGHAVSGSEIDLSWTASTDGAGVKGYRIYRNGNMAGTSTVVSYRDKGLTGATAYQYSVSAYDAAGNVSAHSSTVSVTTSSSSGPSVPTGLAGTAVNAYRVTLSWTASTDNVSVTGYNIYRDGKLAGTSTTASYKDTGLRSATTHLYSVSAHDAAGNVSAQSSTVSVTTSSSSGPSVPAGLAGHAVSGSEIDLSWTASTDGAGVKGYRIYRNGNMAGTSTVVSYRDKGLTGATAYQYSVSAYDAAGNVSAHSSTVSVTTSSSSGPSVPTGLAGTAVNAYRVTLSWTASTDNVSVTGYNIYRDGKLAGTSTTASYKDTGLRSATTHLYSVSAHDAAGNVSAQSSTVSVTTSSSSGPSVPAGLAGHAVSGSEIDLSWTASTDGAGVKGYRIYRNGNMAGTSTVVSYRDKGLTGATAYQYSVSAYDAAGNVSAHSSTVSVTTSSSSGPSVPTGLAGTAVNAYRVTLSWTASTDNVSVTGYNIYRDGKLAGTSTTASYKDTGLRSATTHLYSVSAHDAAGNVSAQSSTVSVTTSSSSGPSVPAGLAGTAVNAYRVTLRWTASTDNVSVTGYNIYRDGKLVGTSTTASYKDTGVRAATPTCTRCPPTTPPGTSAPTAAR